MEELSAIFEKTVSGPWETAGLDVQFKIIPVSAGKLVAFQGSVSPLDWEMNFDFAVRPYRDQPVKWRAHRGFSLAWKSARDIIMPRLAGSMAVLILGYSLGGAMAQLCHEDIRFLWPEMPVDTITFGSPRVFWAPPKALRERMAEVIRVRNVGDAVPTVPPAWLGYRHVGGGIKVGSFKHFLKTLLPIKTGTDLPGAKMHMIPSYREALAKMEVIA